MARPEQEELPQSPIEGLIYWLEEQRALYAGYPALFDSYTRQIEEIKKLPAMPDDELAATCRAIFHGFEEERRPNLPRPKNESRPTSRKRVAQALADTFENSDHKRLERLLAEEVEIGKLPDDDTPISP